MAYGVWNRDSVGEDCVCFWGGFACFVPGMGDDDVVEGGVLFAEAGEADSHDHGFLLFVARRERVRWEAGSCRFVRLSSEILGAEVEPWGFGYV